MSGESELAPFWRAIEEAPKDFLTVGIFADYLEERGSVLAPGMRWLYQHKKRPEKVSKSNDWLMWQANNGGRIHTYYQVPREYLGKRTARYYGSIPTAYKGFCQWFNAAEKINLFRLVTV